MEPPVCDEDPWIIKTSDTMVEPKYLFKDVPFAKEIHEVSALYKYFVSQLLVLSFINLK